MKYKIGERVFVFMNPYQIYLLHKRYIKYRFKFPQITFYKDHVEYDYVHKTRLNFILNILFYIRCYIQNVLFADDRFANVINGKLIDFEELNILPRNKSLALFLKRLDSYKLHLYHNIEIAKYIREREQFVITFNFLHKVFLLHKFENNDIVRQKNIKRNDIVFRIITNKYINKFKEY